MLLNVTYLDIEPIRIIHRYSSYIGNYKLVDVSCLFGTKGEVFLSVVG